MSVLADYASIGIILPGERPLHVDEKALFLMEYDQLAPPSYKETLRYQTIQLVRDGRLVEYTRAMGLAADYAAAPLCVVGAFEHSVGEVMEMAEHLRYDQGLEQAMADHENEHDIVAQLRREAEQKTSFVKRNRRTTRRLLERHQ